MPLNLISLTTIITPDPECLRPLDTGAAINTHLHIEVNSTDGTRRSTCVLHDVDVFPPQKASTADEEGPSSVTQVVYKPTSRRAAAATPCAECCSAWLVFRRDYVLNHCDSGKVAQMPHQDQNEALALHWHVQQATHALPKPQTPCLPVSQMARRLHLSSLILLRRTPVRGQRYVG